MKSFIDRVKYLLFLLNLKLLVILVVISYRFCFEPFIKQVANRYRAAAQQIDVQLAENHSWLLDHTFVKI